MTVTQRRRGSPLAASLLAALLAIGGLPGVTRAATLTTLTLAPSGTVVSTYGDVGAYTATLLDPAPVPGAGISFDAVPSGGGGPVVLGSATTDPAGVAALAANPVTVLGAGHWLVTAHWAGDATWDASDSPSTDLTVGRATLTVTPDAKSVAYGSPTPAYTATVTGFVNGEDELTAAGYVPPSCASPYTSSSPAGTPLTITCAGGSATSYAFDTTATATLTITPAGQAISFTSTAPSSARVGGPTYAPAATATSGLSVAISIAGAAGAVCTIGGSIVSFIGAGTCIIDANQAGDGNHDPAPQVQQSFAVSAATPTTTTVASSANPSTYGASITFDATVTPSTATGSVQFAVDGASFGSPVPLTGGSAASASISTLTGGTHAVTASFTSDDPVNYASSGGTLPGGQVVNKAGQAALAVNVTSPATYGTTQTLTTSGGSGTGAVTYGVGTSNACSVVGTTLSIIAGSGTCVVSATKAADADYDAALSAPRSVTVAKKAVTVTANDTSRRYGAADPTFDATFVGLVGTDNPGTPDCVTTPEAPKVVGGTYPITCTGASLSTASYTYTFQPGTLTITAAPLTATADTKARQYGLPNPPLTATVSGFANGETATTANLTGAPVCTTGALVTDGVGGHLISCARGTLAAPNYYFPTFVDGTLTITQALPAPALAADRNPSPVSATVTFTATVTWPTGTPTGAVTFFEGATDLSGPVPLDGAGRASLATTALPAGSHAIRAVYSGDGANFGGATSTAWTQVVGTSNVDVVLTTNRPAWETGVPITFTATLAPNASGVTVPVTGSVTFRVDGAVKATVPVANGTASWASPALAAGNRTVVASYAPDLPGSASFSAGASAPLTKTVVANSVSASGVGVSGTAIYPVSDGWRDTVAVRGSRLEPLSVSITIYSPAGSRVRTRAFARASGSYAYTWNGRTSGGTILAAGRYKVVQVLADAYGARRSYTSYVTLARKRMYWYTKTLTVSAGPRNYQMRSTTSTSVLSAPSTSTTGALSMVNAAGAPAWIAVGYQFSLPAASAYRSLSFQVRGSWSGATAPKVGIIPWNGGSWGSIYSLTRARATMGPSTTAYYAQTITSLGGIVSGRSVRASIDSFAAPGGYGPGPFRYSITAVRLVVRYGILR